MTIAKQYFLILTAAVLTFFTSLATASVELEFATEVGGDTGALYLGAGNNMYFSFGTMSLLNMPTGSILDGAYLILSDVRIDSKVADYSTSQLNSAFYDTTIMNSSPGLSLYTASGDLIMTGDVYIDTLLTVGASGYLALELDYEISNIQVYGFGQSLIPSELQPFFEAGIADIKIELSKAGTDFTSSIDSKNNIDNIQVTTTITAVPEPGVMALFILGAVVFMRSKKKNS